MALLEFTSNGICCPVAGVYIDPWGKVDYAIITHGHADHARWGHRHYLSTDLAAPVIRHRLGQQISLSTLKFGEVQEINGVKFSFHPAGHIVGSAQVRVEYKGEIWVVSGDYKVESDSLARDFEPVRCHTFITECTFGLPVYRWRPQEEVFASINQWWRDNAAAGKVTLLTGYALGKAQRILQGLDDSIGPVFTHGAVDEVNQVMLAQGIPLKAGERIRAETDKKRFPGSIVIAPPAAVGSPWMKKFKQVSVGVASGWMALRGARRRRGADRGFVLSDHADWPGLMQAIKATGAERVLATHGYTSIFAQWLNEQGWDAGVVETQFEGELGEMAEAEKEASGAGEKKQSLEEPVAEKADPKLQSE